MEEGPEPQEWVERTAEEHHHAHEHGHGHAPEGPKSPVTVSAITAALLAVLAALGSLLSGHAANQALLAQSQATNQWAFYQAKSTKGHLYEVAGELFAALDEASASHMPDKFLTEPVRYEQEKDGIKREAELLEVESRHELHKHHHFALGVSLFQVGIVLASVSILIRYRLLYILSLGAGAGGLICLVMGMMI